MIVWPDRTRAGIFGAVLACLWTMTHTPGVAADFQSVCASPPAHAARIVPVNPDTLGQALSHVRPGDVLMLDSGDYGAVRLVGDNAGFVTLAAGTDAHPVLSSLAVSGSRWVIRGLTVDPRSAGPVEARPTQPGKWPDHPWLVRIAQADDVILEGDTVTSRTGDFPWAAETLGSDDPTPLFNGVIATNAACVTLARNTIYNVFNGVLVEGDQIGNNGKFIRVLNNTIDNFAADGIDQSVSASLIAGNVITNSHDLCNNQCIHTDGIQGWNYHDHPGILNYDVVIDGNTIIQQTADRLPMPGDDLHGITIFDGFWKGVQVINNVVITDTWHGITMTGVDGLLVANNTVVATTSRPTWITAGGTSHEGGLSRNVTIRNNIATQIAPPKVPVANYTADHNLIVDNPKSLFVLFEVAEHRFDVRLKPRGPAVGRGSSDQAPPHDMAGTPRIGAIDLGAYQLAR